MTEKTAPSCIPLLIVSATRLSEQAFLRDSFLSNSLPLHGDTAQLRVKVKFDNREGLPAIYNRAIAHVQPIRIGEICAGRRAITADTALRLSRALGVSPGFWLGLQADYDTEEVERVNADALNHIQPILPLAA